MVALLTILFIICVILTKWSLAHFTELRGLCTLGCILRKSNKVREPPIMIRRSKARIPELVMQRQSPMDTREKENKKC
jgi:hypothetical protein